MKIPVSGTNVGVSLVKKCHVIISFSESQSGNDEARSFYYYTEDELM